MLKPKLVGLQKRLLRGTWIGPMEGRTTGHAAHCKDLHGLPLAIQIHGRLVPIHLSFLTPGVLLWHEHLGVGAQPQRPLSLAHVPPHRRFDNRHLRPLFGDPYPDAMRRVPLLPRRAPVCIKNAVDELSQRSDLRPRSFFGRALVWHGVTECLAHEPTMDAELTRHPGHAAYAELVL